jgi:hypothetical protein
MNFMSVENHELLKHYELNQITSIDRVNPLSTNKQSIMQRNTSVSLPPHNNRNYAPSFKGDIALVEL